MTDPDPSSPEPIAHPGPIEILPPADSADVAHGRLTARFVRYPDCQQLQLWLPLPDLDGGRHLRVQRDDGLRVEDTTLRQRLSGPVQMLFDTLPWPPGTYHLQIGEPGDADSLSLTLVKRQDDAAGATPCRPAPPPAATVPIVYRDGRGCPLPDVDLALREAAFGTLMRRLSRQVHGRLHARGGDVVYEEALPRPRRIVFAQRPGPRAGRWQLAVPPPGHWTAETGFAPDERDEVLRFVAEQLLRHQPPGWDCTIRDDLIDFRDRPVHRG